MLLPSSSGVAVLLLIVNMIAWGLFPLLRELCAAPMPAFALLNMASQLVNSMIVASTVGNSWLGTDESAMQHLGNLMSDSSDGLLKIAAIWAGGFILGHGDHLSALAMSFIPAGVAYPLYSGTALVVGTTLNAAQVGVGSEPFLLLLGLILILSAITCLAIGQDIGTKHAVQSRQNTISLQDAASDKAEEVGIGAALQPASGSSEAERHDPKGLSSRSAMLLCLAAGLCAGGWSPLSTYARASHGDGKPIPGGYVTAFIFAFGQLSAYPSVAWLGTRLGNASMSESFRALTPRRFGFGCLCGIVVNNGYVMYFLASVPISPTIAFCLTACNPLLALGIACLRRQFRDAVTKQKLLLACSALLYVLAIAALASAR